MDIEITEESRVVQRSAIQLILPLQGVICELLPLPIECHLPAGTPSLPICPGLPLKSFHREGDKMFTFQAAFPSMKHSSLSIFYTNLYPPRVRVYTSKLLPLFLLALRTFLPSFPTWSISPQPFQVSTQINSFLLLLFTELLDSINYSFFLIPKVY